MSESVAALLGDSSQAPAATTAPAPESGQAATSAPAGEAGPWYAGLPEDVKGFAEVKGWKDPAEAIKSYQNLEKLMGADKAGKTLMLPKDEADAEGHEALYKALGRPDKPEGYGLTELFKDQPVDTEFMTGMAGAMHQAGLSAKQAQMVAGAYQQVQAQQTQAVNQRSASEVAQLKSTWGKDFEPNVEIARRAARQFGFTNDELNAIDQSFGPKFLLEKMLTIGKALGEDKPVDGQGSNSFNFSPAGAKAKADELLSDPAFHKRYLAGEAGAVEQITRLMMAAAPKE